MSIVNTFLNESDDKNKYHIASFAQGKPYEKLTKDKINILCSGRTLPEFCTENGYKYETIDCFSWTIPQCVGLYALCLQINPELNFKQFTNLCMRSCEKNSNNMRILNAEQLIKNVKQNYIDTQDKFCKS